MLRQAYLTSFSFVIVHHVILRKFVKNGLTGPRLVVPFLLIADVQEVDELLLHLVISGVMWLAFFFDETKLFGWWFLLDGVEGVRWVEGVRVAVDCAADVL